MSKVYSEMKKTLSTFVDEQGLSYFYLTSYLV